MRLQLITLQGVSVDTDIYELMVPTDAGEIAIFPSHEPLVAMAAPGALTVRYKKEDDDTKLDYFAIGGGVIEVTYDAIRVLVDEADHAEDIIEGEAQAALDRALALKDAAKDSVELDKAHQLIDRHVVRLRVAELQRRRRRM